MISFLSVQCSAMYVSVCVWQSQHSQYWHLEICSLLYCLHKYKLLTVKFNCCAVKETSGSRLWEVGVGTENMIMLFFVTLPVCVISHIYLEHTFVVFKVVVWYHNDTHLKIVKKFAWAECSPKYCILGFESVPLVCQKHLACGTSETTEMY